jgi:hypothetical protein
MASKEGMIFKFFEKWKQRRLNKFAKQTLKNNPGLDDALKDLDDEYQKVLDILAKRK